MKRIKSASDLKLFLEAIAIESTKKAKKSIKENIEAEMEYTSRGLKNAKKNQSGYSKYMQIFEVDEEEEAESGDAEEPADDTVADTEVDSEEEPADDSMEGDSGEDEIQAPEVSAMPAAKPKNKATISIPLVDEDPDFEEIVKAIGWVRAGPSIKGETQKELSAYIEKLGSPEKKALYTMLSSMANILHKEITGDKGQNPEDPPLNLIIDDPEKEEEKVEKEAMGQSVENPEDAPIKVGKSQSLNEMRRAVRRLMEK